MRTQKHNYKDIHNKESFTLFIQFVDEDEKRKQSIKEFLYKKRNHKTAPLNSEKCLYSIETTHIEMARTFDELKTYIKSCEIISYHSDNNEYSDCFMKFKNEVIIDMN